MDQRRLARALAGALAIAAVTAACTGAPTAGPNGTGGPHATARPRPTVPADAAVPVSLPASVTSQPDAVTSLPGAPPIRQAQFAGYASTAPTPCAGIRCDGAGENGLFYWFVGQSADVSKSPTIIWTNGGPGSTSFWGFFTENGPYTVTTDLTLTEKTNGWNQKANYLIFDHPLGVGLSFAPDAALPNDVKAGVDQWYQALLHFLERHPEVAANPIVLAGESYGGTYVPLQAKAILDGNQRAGKELVKLRGTILAAPWTDPVIGQSKDTEFAFSHGLITAADKQRLDAVYDRCKAAIEAQTPSSKEANDICGEIKSGIEEISGRYLLNIAQTGDPSTDQVTTYLNDPKTRQALHAKPSGTYAFYSQAIGDRYTIGGQDSYRGTVQEVLDRGVPTMVISGLNDATDVNPLGVGAWLDLLTGPNADAFHRAPTTQWKNGGPDVLGYVQKGGGLRWVKVLGGGHLAVGDQPQLIDLIDQELLRPAG